MTLIIIFSIIFSIILISVYRTFLNAPIKYEDEEKFRDAIKYEERFAKIYENKDNNNLNEENIRVILRKGKEDKIFPPVNINNTLKLKVRN